MNIAEIKIESDGQEVGEEYSIFYLSVSHEGKKEYGFSFEVWESDVDSEAYNLAYKKSFMSTIQSIRDDYETKLGCIINVKLE